MRAVFAHPRPDRARGVFETLLVIAGRAVELEAHMDRLVSSLIALYPENEIPEVASLVEAKARELDEGALRVTAAPRGGELAVSVDSVEIDPDLVLPASPRPVEVRGLEVPGGLGAHKWADRSLLDEARTDLPPGSLPLIVDGDGAVLEASRANLFIARGDALLTPPTDGRILPGITRRRVLGLAAVLEIDASETGLTREDLLGADEVFLTGSVRGIEPVSALDGQRLSQRGDAAARLAAGLRRAWRGGLDRVPRR
jgi:para-aminobenzoate synthetase/4-amino-4-deoxychorismate lyase